MNSHVTAGLLARWVWLIFVAAVQILSTSCRITPPAQRLKAVENVAVNIEQLRLRMRAIVQPMCGVVVASADQIAAGTTNRAIHREALVWKIDAIPALREALFQPDPFTAIFDAWALSFQMADYFENGNGRSLLDESAAAAAATCRQLETEIARIAASMTHSGDVSKAKVFAREWATQHPIRHAIAGRESALNRVTEREVADSFSTSEVMGNVVVTMDDLNRRIEIYSAQLPDQARWQAELFALDVTRYHHLDRALPLADAAMNSASEALEAMTQLLAPIQGALSAIESVPSVVSVERLAVIEAVRSEVSRAIQAIHEERMAVLDYVTLERREALTAFRDTMVQERKAFSNDLTEMGLAMVDHAFEKAARWIGALLAAGVIVVALAFGIFRRRRTAAPTSV